MSYSESSLFATACPNGTYASGNTSGDSTAACVPCPDANHIVVEVPATSVADCVCASGFTTDGYKCEGNLFSQQTELIKLIVKDVKILSTNTNYS